MLLRHGLAVLLGVTCGKVQKKLARKLLDLMIDKVSGRGKGEITALKKFVQERNIEHLIHFTRYENLESILKVDGLDALMIGPYDLSASMNLTGQFENKDFIAVLDEIIQLCTKFNIPTGYHVVTQDDGLLKKKIDEGYRFIAYCTDGIFLTNNSENPY